MNPIAAARAGKQPFLNLLVGQRRSIAVALHIPAFLDDAVRDIRCEHEERVDLTHRRVLPHRLGREFFRAGGTVGAESLHRARGSAA